MLQNIQLTKEDFLNSNWEDAIKDCEDKDCQRYSFILKKKADEEKEPINKEVLTLLAAISSFSLKVDSEDEPFHPFLVFANSRSAIVEDICDSHLDTLLNVMEDVTDPDMQARIADLLWFKRRREYKALTLAITAYLNSATAICKSSKHKTNALLRIQRAYNLSKYQNRKKEVINFIEKFLDDGSLQSKENLALTHGLLEILLSFKQVDKNKYILLITDLANHCHQTKQFGFERKFWEQLSQWYALATQPDKAKDSLVNAAETYILESNEALERKSPSYMAASKFLTNAIVALRRAKGNHNRETVDNKVEELSKRLDDFQKHIDDEMQTISTEVDLSHDIEVSINYVKGKSLLEALFELSKMVFIQEEEKYHELFSQIATENPLQFIISRDIVNRNGQVVGKIPSIYPTNQDEIKEATKYHVQTYANMSRNLVVCGRIKPTIHQIKLEHNVTINDFLEITCNNPFIQPGRELIYAKGLYAGFNYDLLTSIHLLIPQFENSLRYILQQYGEITTTLDDSKQFHRELSLNEIFNQKREKLRSILSARTLFDIDWLLIYPNGANLRNCCAHGLMEIDEFYQDICLYFWGLVLKICFNPFVRFFESRSQTNNLDPSD